MLTKKDKQLLQLLQSMDTEKFERVLSYLKGSGKEYFYIQELRKFYNSGDEKNSFSPPDNWARLRNYASSRVVQEKIKLDVESNQLIASFLKIDLYARASLFENALEEILNGIQEGRKEEHFLLIKHLCQKGISIWEKGGKTKGENRLLEQIQKESVRNEERLSNFLIFWNFWEEEYVPVYKASLISGYVSRETIANFQGKAADLPNEIKSVRARLFTLRIRGFVYKLTQNFSASPENSEEIIELVEHHEWLLKEYSDLILKEALSFCIASSEKGDREKATAGLDRLRKAVGNSDSGQYLGYFILGSLSYADAFTDETAYLRSMTAYLGNEEKLNASMPTSDHIFTLFYFLRGCFIFNTIQEVPRWVLKIDSFKKSLVHEEVQVFTRILQILYYHSKRDYFEVLRLGKNALRFIKRASENDYAISVEIVKRAISLARKDLPLSAATFEFSKTLKAKDQKTLTYLPIKAILASL